MSYRSILFVAAALAAGPALAQSGTLKPATPTGVFRAPAPGTIRIDLPLADGNEGVIAINGPGRVTINGGLCMAKGTPPSAICQRSIPKGSKATLIPEPRNGYEFLSWAGACAGQGARCFLTPTKDFSTSATFGQPTPQPMVKIRVAIPVGGGKVGNDVFASSKINCDHQKADYYGGTCETSVPMGTSIALKATPEPGIQFTGWTSDQPGCKNQECSFKATDPVTISAGFFDPTSVKTLTVLFSRGYVTNTVITTDANLDFKCTPEGLVESAVKTGWIVSCTAQVKTASVVHLKAVAAATLGAFPITGKGWAGDCTGTAGDTCTLSMNNSKTVILNLGG